MTSIAGLVQIVVVFSIASMVIFMIVAGFAITRRFKNLPDRLLVADMITTLLISIMILLAITQQTDTTIDMAIALAALASTGTFAVAHYIRDEPRRKRRREQAKQQKEAE